MPHQFFSPVVTIDLSMGLIHINVNLFFAQYGDAVHRGLYCICPLLEVSLRLAAVVFRSLKIFYPLL